MSLPLEGMLVLDLSRLLPGPFCSLILADLGARVIKVEDQNKGDYLIHFPPIIGGESLAYQAVNRGKENIVFDFRNPKELSSLKKLIRKADVVVESYRPGILSKMGLDYGSLRRINPRLIMASITGFGQEGALKTRAGHDVNFLSQAGMVETSVISSVQWADIVGGGIWSALSIVAALTGRQKSKKGVHLDLSMTDAMLFVNHLVLTLSQMGVKLDILSGVFARYRIYRTKDKRLVCLAALEAKFWNEFCAIVRKPHLKAAEGHYPDIKKSVHEELTRLFASRPMASWVKIAQKGDFCLTAALSPREASTSPLTRSRKNVLTGRFGKKKLLFFHAPFSRLNAGKIRFAKASHPGANTAKIKREFKL